MRWIEGVLRRGPALAASLLLAHGPAAAAGSGASGAPARNDAPAKRLPPLELTLAPEDVDLDRGQLVLRLSRPAARVTLKVLSPAGEVLAEVEQRFDATPAGSPLGVSWPVDKAPRSAVARIEVFGHDIHDYFKGVALTPWSFEIPHEDVVFATDSADIVPAEAKKLEASLRLIRRELPRFRHLGNITLFILAHTDTVGSDSYNLALSTRRARAIAAWFRKAGLGIPIAYDGVGERALKVATADEVDEPRNRVVDYMLSVEPPRFERSRAAPSWKRY